jgi:pimeloyl-ACP methyl ester carboxylesterase
MRLAYDDDGHGTVVVLLHGFPLDRTMWTSQQTALSSLYRVIAPDLRGHGQSDAPSGIYPMEDLANDVVELLDTLKINEPVVLGGLSMGGYVALALAVRHAKRLRGLMLMDTRAAADTPEAARGREETARKVEEAGSAEPAVSGLLPKLFSPTTPQRRPELIARTKDQMLKTPVNGIVGALRGMAIRPDRTGDLGRINVPALVLVGLDDTITPPVEARQLSKALPNAELVEIPDAGHLSPLENPAPVNAAILRYLESIA